ncbi:MAG: ATPase, partial [Synechococcus sp. MED650]|nr:ATPase [Synechococcus sp. MED650]
MQPRSEPLLWLQCLALGAIPLELMLIRLLLAGADPGPIPGVERLLLWGIGVVAPAIALWKRPADWASLLVVRQKLSSRDRDQLQLSAAQQGPIGLISLVVASLALGLLIGWLDDSAVLTAEFSPVLGQSRLETLLLCIPVLALIVWQVQQLAQAGSLLLGLGKTESASEAIFTTEMLRQQRTSLGLQLLQLPRLSWPAPKQSSSLDAEITEDRSIADDNTEVDKTEVDKTEIESTPEPEASVAG